MSEFEALDALFTAKERVQLELGWACNEWLEQERKDARADRSPRAALTYALTILSDRYADTFSSNYSARKNICTWMRVSRFFTRDLVEELPGRFTFHHLRKCYVGGIWPDPNGTETWKNVNECIEYAKENDGRWPSINVLERAEKDLWQRLLEICDEIVTYGGYDDYKIKMAKQILAVERKWQTD
jgi:hypothetical protein